jgi:response regulator RpfG family c-di-GMP phosphodiesterase
VNNDIFKVFILEDMEADMALNKRQVRKFNSSVLFATARNRTEFTAKLIEFQPDIVLSDYNLPDMNGLEALLYVREHLDSTPFIFITGILNDEERVAETILNGASGYLLKENLRNLPELLEKVLSKNTAVLQRKEQEWEQRRNNQMDLQKTIATLRKSDHPDRDVLVQSLQRVFDSLS